MPHFYSQKQAHCFKGVVSSIDIISQKEIVCVRDVASNLKKLHEIIELAMNISTYVDWGSHIDNIRLFGKDLFSLIT